MSGSPGAHQNAVQAALRDICDEFERKTPDMVLVQQCARGASNALMHWCRSEIDQTDPAIVAKLNSIQNVIPSIRPQGVIDASPDGLLVAGALAQPIFEQVLRTVGLEMGLQPADILIASIKPRDRLMDKMRYEGPVFDVNRATLVCKTLQQWTKLESAIGRNFFHVVRLKNKFSLNLHEAPTSYLLYQLSLKNVFSWMKPGEFWVVELQVTTRELWKMRTLGASLYEILRAPRELTVCPVCHREIGEQKPAGEATIHMAPIVAPQPALANDEAVSGRVAAGSSALRNVMDQTYIDMLSAAPRAYEHLVNMRLAHLQGNHEVAVDFFQCAQEESKKVGDAVRHIIDGKFDMSVFKCRKSRCIRGEHPSCHVDPQIPLVPVNYDVPEIFRGKEWNLKFHFESRWFDGQPFELRSHLDYVWAKAEGRFTEFHEFLSDISHGVGIYYEGPLKMKHRCASKCSDYANLPKPASMHLKDLLRGTIVCRLVEHITKGLRKLVGRMTRIQDRLQDQTHDVLVNFIFKGMTCEVQFHLAEFYPLKAFSHGPYDVTRADVHTELLNASGELVLKPFHLHG